jgi:hypothetical protein
MSATSPGARRISKSTSRTVATVTENRTSPIDPVVDATFTSVCAAIFLSLFIMAAILGMGTARPVPVYGIVGSAIFGAVFGAFLTGALHLAVTDSRRHKEDDH